jgi:hypothetical protein
MIILSVGMPRAGSGWYYNLTHDLVTASGGQDARQIRRRYHLGRVLTEVNCNIGALTTPRLLAVLPPSLLGNTFAIKAHAGPTPFSLQLIRSKQLRVAYIYRDPRDALLSAFDNGQRALQKGRPNAFSHLTDFDKAVEFMLEYLRIWEAWSACDLILHSRYEDLLTGYDREAARLVDFLGLDGHDPALHAVLDKYRPDQVRAEQVRAKKEQATQKGIHFNKGKIGRFRQRLSPEQQAVLADKFGPYLARMGYEI